jgi:hypothetical protein
VRSSYAVFNHVEARSWRGTIRNAAVVIIATVRNVGAPSVVEDYRLRIAVADGSEVSHATAQMLATA